MTPIVFTPPAIHAPGPRTAVDYERLVRVLCAIEGGDWTKPGGALQFTHQVWREETRLPYRLSQYEPQAKIIAQIHLSRMAATARRFDVEPTVLLLAGAWKHGLSGSMRRVKENRLSDYQKRAAALYADPTFQ